MDCINFSFEGENLCDIPWASKNFACSFCKREFRSAQALGGHMNVHRRDRARLRLLPSTFSSEICPQNPNPNPNSYFSSSSSSSSAAKPCFPHNYSSWASPSMRKALLVSTPSSTASISTADENYKKPKFDFSSSPQISHAHPSFLPKTGKILKGFAQKDVDDDEFNKVDLKKEKNTSWMNLDLDLEMGFFKDQKEEVDLELRLGHL